MSEISIATTWVLLPGFDGTGLLFDGFVDALPVGIKPIVVRFPTDRHCTAAELLGLVIERIPENEPYVLIAESFSGPLALRAAVSHIQPPIAVVLCASFAKCPIPRLLASLLSMVGLVLARCRKPKFLVRSYLLGDCQDNLLSLFHSALASVSPRVFGRRFQTLREFDEKFVPAGLEIPLLYLLARRDRVVRRRSLAWIRTRYPHVAVEQLDSPHFVLQTHPGPAVHQILNFLTSIPRSASGVADLDRKE